MIERVKNCVIGTLLVAVLGYVQVVFGQDAGAKAQANQKEPPVQGKNADAKGSQTPSGQIATPSDFVIGESDMMDINACNEPKISQIDVEGPPGKTLLPVI